MTETVTTPIRPLVYAPPLRPAFTLIHGDDHLLVLNKPSGLLTVPGKAAAHRDCLEARVRRVFPTARIVHRLDMDTSGVIVMALTAHAHRHLGLQFERRHVSKTYVARVAGHPEADTGTVDLPLRCDWPNRPRQMVDHAQGRAARTGWQVLEREPGGAARVRLTPLTGRSHQLRVHMLSLGHPILGDPLYGGETTYAAAPRLQLHAEMLEVRHPDGGAPVRFLAECPF